ncbi:MAG: hypothetical protein LBG27_10415 [Spirochaetaceae bacterium]|jgi:hypothetical protein|nr:hypothetical protein [Spirochaetaceae bacterium]
MEVKRFGISARGGAAAPRGLSFEAAYGERAALSPRGVAGIGFGAAVLILALGVSGCGAFFGGDEAESGGDPEPSTLMNINTVTDEENTRWAFANSTLTITANGNYVIVGTGEPTANRIVVDSGVTAYITLNTVNIDVSEEPNACAFDMTGATVTPALSGGTVLKSSGTEAGLQAPEGATLTITSAAGSGSPNGTLSAYGGLGNGEHSGAGIGGGCEGVGGSISINGEPVEKIALNGTKTPGYEPGFLGESADIGAIGNKSATGTAWGGSLAWAIGDGCDVRED